MKKIAFLNTKSSVWGGVERYIATVVPVIRSCGYEVSAVFEDHPDNDDGFPELFNSVIYADDVDKTMEKLKEDNIQAVFVHKFESPQLLEKIKEKFRTVFIVHDHDYYCFRRHKYFPVIRKNCSRPNNFFICSLCSGMVNKVFGKIRPVNVFRKQKNFKLVKSSDHFVVLSDHMAGNLQINGFKTDAVSKIYPIKEVNDVEVEYKKGRILYVGQIVRGKGFDLLLDALSRVKSDFHLDVLGKGDDEERTNTLIKDLGLENKVTLHGWVRDPEKYFEKTSFTIFPSRWQEPFGLVGIESFSYGKPVVGFDVGGVCEWLKDGKNGCLIPAHNTQQMAEKIDHLLADDELVRKMGEYGKQMVKNEYGKEKFSQAFLKMMEKLSV